MERSFLLKRGEIDLETGRFPLTLFTNGEASDGHIVDIAGLEVSDNTPMFINHNPDPVQRTGRLENPRKPGKKTQLGGARMTFDGVIDVEGEGAMPDIRRDIAHGIHVGDITAMSGRWDPISATPRASLRKDHYAYSDISGGFDTPMFFEKARVLEGSIVGVPADAAAMIGRSQDLKKPEHVRKFWDVLVNGDPLSRDRALESLYVDASSIEGWEEIECEDGKVFVPAGVARVYGLSIDGEAEADLDRILGDDVPDIEREQASLTGPDADDATEPEAEAEPTTESTDPEPVSAPSSEETEAAEPVSAPPAAATERAAVALPDLPSEQERRVKMRSRLIQMLARETGYIK